MTAEIKSFISEVEKTITETTSGISDVPEIKSQIDDARSHLQKLKNFVAWKWPNLDDEWQKALNNSLQALSDKIGIVRENINNSFLAFETAIQSLSPSDQEVPFIKTKITAVRLAMQKVRADDYKTYNTQLPVFSDFQDFFENKVPTILERKVYLDGVQAVLKQIENDSDVIKKDTTIAKLLSQANAEVQKLFWDIHNDSYSAESLADICSQIEVAKINRQSLNDIRIATLPKTPAEADPEKIKEYIPGTEEQKVWNLKLLQTYSRSFQTSWVNADNTSGTESMSLIGSIIKAKNGKRGGKNGPDAPTTGTPTLDAQNGWKSIGRDSTADELRSVYDADGNLVQFEKGAAEQVNDPEELTQMYLSLAQEHYLTLLVTKDRQNGNEDGKKSLPGFMHDKYDEVAKNTPIEWSESAESSFVWNGFDGNDFWPGDDEYKFSSPEDKQIFLESTMKLMPFLDAMSAQYAENSDPSLMEKVFTSMSIESQYDIYKTIVTALIATRNPIVTLLGWLSMEAFWQKFIDFPWMWYSLRGIIWIARAFIRKDGWFWWYADALSGWTTKYLSTFDTLKWAYTSEWNREVEGRFVREIALKKLESHPDSDAAKRYALVNDLIQQRMLGDVTITYTNGRTLVLKKITPQFWAALLALQKHYLERDFYNQCSKKKDESARQDFINNTSIIFSPDNTTYEAMIDLACASDSFWGQVLSGNVIDTSRTTEEGFWRIMRAPNNDFSGQNSSPGTRWNMIKNWLWATLGTFIRRITNRFPWRFQNNPAYIYSRSWALPFWIGRNSSRDAAAFIDYVDKSRDSIGIKFLISYDEIHHDVDDLLRNDHGHSAHGTGGHGHGPHGAPSNTPTPTETGTVFFDNPQERELLEHFAHAISPEHGGDWVIEQRNWEFAVVTMWYVCRWSELDPHHDETHNLHTMADIIAHINSASLTQTNKDRIRFFYNKMKDKTAEFTPEEIIEMGKLTKARVDITIGTDVTSDANNHIVWEGRTKMDDIEKKFYNDGLSVEDLKKEYWKWFKKYAKCCGEWYDPEKHTKLIEAQRIFADKLRAWSTLDVQIREGTYIHDTVDKAIEDAVGTPIKKDLSNLTATFRNSFFDARRQELLDQDNARVQQATAELTPKIDAIKQSMIDGQIRSKADFEAQIRTTLNGIKPQKVALQFINSWLPNGTLPFASNRFQDAVTAYWNHSFNIYESRINGIITNISTATDWEKKLDFLREYLTYGESANTVLDASGLALNTRGTNLVTATYETIHNAVKLIPSEKAKYEAFEKYKSKVASNPKPQESAFLVEMEAHFGKQKRAIIQKLETALQWADFDTVSTAYNAEKTSVENDYGHELCQDAINSTQIKFNELERVYVTSQVEEIQREKNADINVMVQNASQRINALATKVWGRHVAEIQKARNWVKQIEAWNSAVVAIAVEVEQNWLPEADAKDRVKAILASNTEYAAAFPTTAYDKISIALRAHEAARTALEAFSRGKNMAEKIAQALVGKNSIEEKYTAIVGIYAPATPEFGIVKASEIALFAQYGDGQWGLDPAKITNAQFLDAFTQDLVYRFTGGVDLDGQHAALISDTTRLAEINASLNRAGVAAIWPNINTHVRGARK